MKIILFTVAGFALGYYVAKQHLEYTYVSAAQQEIMDAKEFYYDKYVKDVEAEDTNAFIKRESDFVEMGLGRDEKHDLVSPENIKADVEMSPQFKMYNEAAKQYSSGIVPPQAFPAQPYVITPDEYIAGSRDYDQISLTYYEGDKVMVDAVDEVITPKDVEKTVGAENLEKFGEDSDDADSVYIRNDKLRMDYEIVRSTGHYAVEVLGLDTVTGDRE